MVSVLRFLGLLTAVGIVRRFRELVNLFKARRVPLGDHLSASRR